MQEWVIHVLWLLVGVSLTAFAALFYRRHELRILLKCNTSTISPSNGVALARISDLNDHLAVKEQDLLKADAKFRALFEHAPVLINSFDVNKKPDLWNKECERILGYTREELEEVDNVMELFYTPEEVPYVWKDIKKAKGQFKEYTVRVKSGRRIKIAWANMPLPDGTTIGVGYVVKKIRQGSVPTTATRKSRPTIKKKKKER